MSLRLRAVREAFTPELQHPTAKLVWALRALLAGLAAYSLVVTPQFTTRPLLVFSALSGLLASVAFAFVPTRRPRTLKLAEAAVLFQVAAHVVGHAFGVYARWPIYDTALHFSLPVVTALLLYALSQATDWIWDWRRVRPVEVGIYLFSMTLALGALWEILEFGMDQLAGTREQDSLFDTMIDLIADTMGALLGAVVAAIATRHGRRHGLDTVSEEPKRPVAARAPTRASRE